MYGYETAWALTDSSGATVLERSGFEDGRFYQESFCLAPNDLYTFTITDSYGDGICCWYGSGKYTVHYNGEVIEQGGKFSYLESILLGDR